MKRKLILGIVLAMTSSVVLTACNSNSTKKTETETVVETKAETESASEKDSESESDTRSQRQTESLESKETTKSTESETKAVTESKVSTEDDSVSAEDKQAYLDSLAYAYELEEKIQTANTQTELNEASAAANDAWDTELNNIYQLLQDKLPADQKSELEAEQLNWIANKDDSLALISEQLTDASIAPLEINMQSMTMTKARTLELIEIYFNYLEQ